MEPTQSNKNQTPPAGDQNVERLIQSAYDPQEPSDAFVRRATAAMLAAARKRAARQASHATAGGVRRSIAWSLPRKALAACAAAAIIAGVMLIARSPKAPLEVAVPLEQPRALPTATPLSPLSLGALPAPTAPQEIASPGRMVPRAEPPQPEPARIAVGDTVRTAPAERKRLALPDGSVLYVNADTVVMLAADRRVDLAAGEVYVEVHPCPQADANEGTFVVRTPTRQVTAMGTRFSVKAQDGGTSVIVTQGKVRVTGLDELVYAGRQLLPDNTLAACPRPAAALDWMGDLVAMAHTPLVPHSEHAGGSLVAATPDGTQVSLSLRNYHVDVHVEDGFARTTIDQTYFNADTRRLEGTFYFPLPADASLSRLAMYVDGKLMEGGMAEREHARNVFESIVRRMKDPALLEWVDGTTFKMRVFPLEGRQEKRIILSYSQRLAADSGQMVYRFPAGHSLAGVRDWSFHARLKNAAAAPEPLRWSCQSHATQSRLEGGDFLLDASARDARLDRDVVIQITDPAAAARTDMARFSTAHHEGADYLMLRFQPSLAAERVRPRRDWAVLFECSADRDPLLARAQIEVVRSVLANIEHDDRFAVVTVATHAYKLTDGLVPASAANIQAALDKLQGAHLVGALDLEAGLAAAGELFKDSTDGHVLHVGNGTPVLGQRRQEALVDALGRSVRYVGVGVGKNWNRSFMKAAAAATDGYFTQINPDENIAWRAFELLGSLNTPRLMNVKVVDAAEAATFLTDADSVAHGQEVCAIARIAGGALPAAVKVTGTLSGQPWSRTIAVSGAAAGADYLPRSWARLEIDRLVAAGAQQNKDRIVELSKAMYVMSPFTSLLVLENEAMYAQHNIDRGRKDHWALYPCPPTIPVVTEPSTAIATPTPAPAVSPWTGAQASWPSVQEALGTVLVRLPQVLEPKASRILGLPHRTVASVADLCGAYAIPFGYGGNDLDEWGDPSCSFGGITLSNGVGMINSWDVGNPLGIGRVTLTHNGGFAAGTINSLTLRNLGRVGFHTLTSDGDFDDDRAEFGNGRSVYDIRDQAFSDRPFRGPMINLGGATRPFVVYDWDSDGVPLASGVVSPYYGDGIGTYYFGGAGGRLIVNGALGNSAPGYYGAIVRGWGTANGNGFVDYDGRSLIINSGISNGELVKSGAGYLRLSNITTTLSGGELVLTGTAATAIVSGQLDLYNGRHGTAMLGLGTWKDSADYYGSYAVTHGRYGITNLSVHNTYSGGTYLNGGTLILNSASALGIVSGNNITVADGGILTSGGADIDVVTVPHDMDEAFVAEVRSKLGISDRPLFINGRWSYGTPAVMYDSNREIQFDAEAGDRLPYVGMLGIVSGSVLDGTVDIGPDLAAYEYQADPFSWRRKSGFVKDGPGLLVLTGRNTYAGTTTISGGVLRSRTAPGAFLDDIQVDFLLEEQLREKSATTSGWMWQDRWVHGPLRQYLPQVCEAAPYVTLASGLGNVAGVLAFVPPAAQQYRPAGMAARRSAVSADTWPRLRPMVDKLLSEPLPATRGAALNTLHVQRVVQNVGDVLGRVQQELAGGQSAWPFMPVLQPLLQQPVKYRMDDAKFRDLLQYAPGLNTSVEDVEALLEAEVQYGVRPAVGKIDPRAELLIERCRKAPWQSIITAGPDGGSILTFDGAGRYVSQGPTPQGLAETVICDGNTIVHMYGELGLASQRVDSRFHRRAFIERVPWLVPPAGDLSVGANVTLAADDTIAVEPLAGGVAEQLVFAPGGNLAERRLVKAGKVLARQTYSPDGAIVTYDANGVATAASRPTLPAVEPNLKPDLAATVVLPLPIRDVRYHQIYSRSGVGSYPDRRSDEQLLAYAWSCLGEHNGDAATILGGFIARGDRRLGLYVLLLAAQGRCGGANGVLHLPKHQFRLEVAADHPHSPAAAYVQAMMLPAGANANLPQAVAAVGLLHDLALLEQLQRVAAPQAPATRPQDSAKNILAALPKFKTAHVAWVAAALAMQCDPMAETVRQLAAATEKLPAVAGLSPSVRCEMAAALYRAGDSNTAAAMFEGLFREPVAAGRVPMLSAVMASALGEARGGGEVDELVKSAAGEFARSGSPAIVALAAQCEQLGKRDLAASVLRMLAAGDAAPALAATRLRALLAAGQLDEAWQAVQAAGADPELAASPWLWRVGYVAAEGLGRTADATACLDRALDLEYQRLGDSVDVPTVEAQYGELLSHYQDAVREVRGRGAAVSPEQLAMVIRAADRWRALTGNEAAACAAAANVFMMAGQYELAWEYATSPLALRPNDPGPLAGLGRQLRDASLPGLAAHAFASAFGAAPTDPSYLWEQARALEQDGQSAQAIALYRQIANGQWRSQFDSLKSDAREALEKGRRE